MSAGTAKRILSDVPEAAVITRLLSEVTRTLPSTIPSPETVRSAPQAPPAVIPAPAPPPTVFTPPPRVAPSLLTPVVSPSQPKTGVVPVGELAVADFFALVNWKNRPEDAKPLPTVAPERPSGHEWTVEAVMSAFLGD